MVALKHHNLSLINTPSVCIYISVHTEAIYTYLRIHIHMHLLVITFLRMYVRMSNIQAPVPYLRPTHACIN